MASDPRLFKEARTLLDDGHRVRIVAADIIPSLSSFDADLLASLECECIRVPWNASPGVRLFRTFRQRLARLVAGLFSVRVPLPFASHALHALTPALSRTASREPADLYIAHNLAALPAAATAARKYCAKLGFDAEDYHCGELEDMPANRVGLRIRRSIESCLVPRCQHLTSASPGISEAYANDYGVNMTPILNVFPLSEAPAEPVRAPSARGELASLYWFSQTIGGERGLEQIVEAMAKMRTRARLCLRGNATAGYVDHLQTLARRLGGADLERRIQILPVSSPGEMIRLAAKHDMGLATELSEPTNRDLCLTNKIFTYLAAGVPVLLSSTSAQKTLAIELGLAALLVDLDDSHRVAHMLDAFLADEEGQTLARAKAWQLGRERYNWEAEQTKFLESVARALQ